MKKILLLLTICTILVTSIYAITTLDETELTPGKNNITTPSTFKPIYVKDFIRKNPDIDVISYRKNNETIGYVNAFGGIGENFVIYPEKEYEIVTKLNTTIILQ